jgi:hypothetical protein
MKKIIVILVSFLVFLLAVCLIFSGCGKEKEQKLTFKALMDTHLGKDITISMWNPEKSKSVVNTYTVVEVNSDYLVIKEQGEKEVKIAVPFSNVTCLVTTETPPVLVLNDQIMLNGFGETIDGLGYVGSRIERIGRTTKTEQ